MGHHAYSWRRSSWRARARRTGPWEVEQRDASPDIQREDDPTGLAENVLGQVRLGPGTHLGQIVTDQGGRNSPAMRPARAPRRASSEPQEASNQVVGVSPRRTLPPRSRWSGSPHRTSRPLDPLNGEKQVERPQRPANRRSGILRDRLQNRHAFHMRRHREGVGLDGSRENSRSTMVFPPRRRAHRGHERHGGRTDRHSGPPPPHSGAMMEVHCQSYRALAQRATEACARCTRFPSKLDRNVRAFPPADLHQG